MPDPEVNNAAGEESFIRWIRARAGLIKPDPSSLVVVGTGDDLAVLDWPRGDLVMAGVDQCLDGIHFDSKIHSPQAIGIKAVNRNLSDCAAMGCRPAALIISAALPSNLPGGSGLEYAKNLYI